YGDLEAGTRGPRSISTITDATGHYRLHTDNDENGAVAGKHRVCILDYGVASDEDIDFIISHPEEATKREIKVNADKLRVPIRYCRSEKTPLRAEVKPDEKQIFNFDIP